MPRSHTLDVTVVWSDKQQYLYAALSTPASATSSATARLSLNSDSVKPTANNTTTTTTTEARTTAADADGDDDVDSLPRRQQLDPAAAMSRITMGVHLSESPSSSSTSSTTQPRHPSSADKCKYGVETNDLSALEQVRRSVSVVSWTIHTSSLQT